MDSKNSSGPGSSALSPHLATCLSPNVRPPGVGLFSTNSFPGYLGVRGGGRSPTQESTLRIGMHNRVARLLQGWVESHLQPSASARQGLLTPHSSPSTLRFESRPPASPLGRF